MGKLLSIAFAIVFAATVLSWILALAGNGKNYLPGSTHLSAIYISCAAANQSPRRLCHEFDNTSPRKFRAVLSMYTFGLRAGSYGFCRGPELGVLGGMPLLLWTVLVDHLV